MTTDVRPIRVDDLVMTKKGARYFGKVVCVYNSLDGVPHAVVEATTKGFERTQHLYPLVQLEHC